MGEGGLMLEKAVRYIGKDLLCLFRHRYFGDKGKGCVVKRGRMAKPILHYDIDTVAAEQSPG